MSAPGRHRQQEPHSPPPRRSIGRAGWIVVALVGVAAVVWAAVWSVPGVLAEDPPAVVTPSWAPAAPTTSAPVPATVISGDQLLDVGTEVAPGVYRTTGPISTDQECYFARLSRDADEPSLVTVIRQAYAGGPTEVTIKASDDVFRTRGCSPWVRISATPSTAAGAP